MSPPKGKNVETKVALTLNGQEVSQSDFNLVAQEAALADDAVLAELLRPAAADAVLGPYKYVIPSGGQKGASSPRHSCIVSGSGIADARIVIRPFRAVIGGRTLPGDGAKAALRDIRSALYVDNTYGLFRGALQLPVQTNPASSRWDLIYARVDVDQADTSIARYVKSGPNAATSEVIPVTTQTIVSIGMVQGTVDGGVTRPALPADAGGAYYIALAYVRLYSHTLTTRVWDYNVEEIYEPLLLAPATGVATQRPAQYCYKVGGSPSPCFMPPSMVGGVTLWVPIDADDADHVGEFSTSEATPSVPVNGTVVLDATIDWRNRLFDTIHHQSLHNSQDKDFPWSGGPGAGEPLNITWRNKGQGPFIDLPGLQIGQSFEPDFDAGVGGNGGKVLHMYKAAPSTAELVVFVDEATGALKGWRNNVNYGYTFLLKINASAPRF